MINNTPVELYEINGVPVYVKREDLCTSAPAPPFSKVRGLIRYLERLQNRGVTTVGYVETAISMAGWGVAWACYELGMRAIIFDPQYKVPNEVLQFHRSKWDFFKAEVVPIKAGMARVNWNICVHKLRNLAGDAAVLLPLGLPFEESIEATAEEFRETIKKHGYVKSIVVNVGSGTIAAGVYRGAATMGVDVTIYGIMGRTGDEARKLKVIGEKAKVQFDMFQSAVRFKIYDPGWLYMDKSESACPFPCHKFYDLKAWEWLVTNFNRVEQPILFWNIGH